MNRYFFADPQKSLKSIDTDGLPIPGRLYMEGDPYYSFLELETNSFKVKKFEHSEPAYCGLVRILEADDLVNTKGKCVCF